MPTRTMGNKGVTLIEGLVGTLLLSIILLGIMGAYYLSLYTVSQGRHIAVANSTLQSYMNREIQAGYAGGSAGGAYYAASTLAAGPSINVTIDDRGTADTSDDLMGVLTCSPWYPDNIRSALGGDLRFEVVRYKITGFTVSWVEGAPLTGQAHVCSVSAASYVCEHNA